MAPDNAAAMRASPIRLAPLATTSTDRSSATARKMIDLPICAMSQPRGAATLAAVRVLSGSLLAVSARIAGAAQARIMKRLQPTIDRYDLGVLAEEGSHDDSRLHKHAFWAVDPLDGTQCFIEGQSGFATSIALVSQQGDPVLGVVYDPVNDRMYEAVRGAGVTVNGQSLSGMPPLHRTGKTVWFADRSLKSHPNFEAHASNFDVRFVGGAVMNGIHVLTTPNSVYAKPPKAELGGCAIWDLAAVSLMVEEHGGRVSTFNGQRLPLNRCETVFFNDLGLSIVSADRA